MSGRNNGFKVRESRSAFVLAFVPEKTDDTSVREESTGIRKKKNTGKFRMKGMD